MLSERTWIIRDIDGSNPRRVTLAQYRAEIDAAKVAARAKFKTDCAREGLPCYLQHE